MRRALSVRILPIAFCFLWMSTATAHADSGCSASVPDFFSRLQCRLHSILHILDAIAVLLGIALLVVVILAVRYYRRTKNTNEPTE